MAQNGLFSRILFSTLPLLSLHAHRHADKSSLERWHLSCVDCYVWGNFHLAGRWSVSNGAAHHSLIFVSIMTLLGSLADPGLDQMDDFKPKFWALEASVSNLTASIIFEAMLRCAVFH